MSEILGVDKRLKMLLEKRENVVNQHVLLFHDCFCPIQLKFQFLGHVQFAICIYFPSHMNFVVWSTGHENSFEPSRYASYLILHNIEEATLVD